MYFKNTKGAALVEYMPILAMIAVVLPALWGFGQLVPQLFDEPGPFDPGGPEEIIIDDCVVQGQCEPPEEVYTYCFENTASGDTCDIIPWIVVDPPYEPPYITPTNQRDPQIQWVEADLDLGVYANSKGSTEANNSDIAAYNGVVNHPAGTYCIDRGGMLPSYDDLAAMAPYNVELNMVSNIYWSSSQYWAAGGYNPPPVLRDLAYVKNFSFAGYNSGSNGDGHGFLTHSFYVRCIYRP